MWRKREKKNKPVDRKQNLRYNQIDGSEAGLRRNTVRFCVCICETKNEICRFPIFFGKGETAGQVTIHNHAAFEAAVKVEEKVWLRTKR